MNSEPNEPQMLPRSKRRPIAEQNRPLKRFPNRPQAMLDRASMASDYKEPETIRIPPTYRLPVIALVGIASCLILIATILTLTSRIPTKPQNPNTAATTSPELTATTPLPESDDRTAETMQSLVTQALSIESSMAQDSATKTAIQERLRPIFKAAWSQPKGRTGAALNATFQYFIDDQQPDLALLAGREAISNGSTDPSLHRTVANLLIQKSRYDEAETLLRKLVSAEDPDLKAEKLLATLLINTQQYEESLAHYRRATPDPSMDPTGALNIATVLGLHLQRYDEAIALIEPALTALPDRPDATNLYALTLLQAKQYEKAAAAFSTTQTQLKTAKPEVAKSIIDGGFAVNYALALSESGKAGEAQSLLEEAISLPGKRGATARNNLAYLMLAHGGNVERATQLARDAVATDPSDISFVDTFAQALAKSGSAEEARRILEKAVQRTPNVSADILIHLGDYTAKAGERYRALELYTQAAAKTPHDPALVQKIANLKKSGSQN